MAGLWNTLLPMWSALLLVLTPYRRVAGQVITIPPSVTVPPVVVGGGGVVGGGVVVGGGEAGIPGEATLPPLTPPSTGLPTGTAVPPIVCFNSADIPGLGASNPFLPPYYGGCSAPRLRPPCGCASGGCLPPYYFTTVPPAAATGSPLPLPTTAPTPAPIG